MCEEKTCGDTTKCICSPGSGAGASRSEWPDGPTTNQSGPEAAPASRSASQAGEPVQMTLGTFGPTCEDSSPSAGQKSSSGSRSPVPPLSERLGERLMQRLARFGSMEYSLTWKRRVTPQGRVFYQQRASGRRTSGKGCGGWPTARAEDSESTGAHRGSPDTLTSAAQVSGWPTPRLPGGGMTSADHSDLPGVAALTGWPPPNSANADRGGFATEEGLRERMESGHQKNLQEVVGIAGWCTPNAMDGGQTSRGGDRIGEALLAGQAQATGATPGSPAQTGPRGVLNPQFPLWLMGYPEAWATCAPGHQGWETVQEAFSRRPDGSARALCEGQATP